MLKVTTAKEMQEIDRAAIERYGIAGAILMERAGLAVVLKINELFVGKKGNRHKGIRHKEDRVIIVLCGGGNNGGDGLVIARILHDQGRDVKVFLSVKPVDLKGDAAINYKAVVKVGVNISPIKKFLTYYLSLIPYPSSLPHR